jgi:hypothetical protein
MEAGWNTTQRAHVTTCKECGCHSGLRWAGWRAYRVDEPEYGDAPAIAFYCPSCAAAEFDGKRT